MVIPTFFYAYFLAEKIEDIVFFVIFDRLVDFIVMMSQSGNSCGSFEEIQYLNRNRSRLLEQNRLAARHALLPNAVNVADARGGVIFLRIN